MSDIIVSDDSLPGKIMPESSMPRGSILGGKTPESNVSESNIPEVNIPESNILESNAPESSVPAIDKPDSNEADVDVSESNMTGGNESSNDVSNTNEPDSTEPGGVMDDYISDSEVYWSEIDRAFGVEIIDGNGQDSISWPEVICNNPNLDQRYIEFAYDFDEIHRILWALANNAHGLKMFAINDEKGARDERVAIQLHLRAIRSDSIELAQATMARLPHLLTALVVADSESETTMALAGLDDERYAARNRTIALAENLERLDERLVEVQGRTRRDWLAEVIAAEQGQSDAA